MSQRAERSYRAGAFRRTGSTIEEIRAMDFQSLETPEGQNPALLAHGDPGWTLVHLRCPGRCRHILGTIERVDGRQRGASDAVVYAELGRVTNAEVRPVQLELDRVILNPELTTHLSARLLDDTDTVTVECPGGHGPFTVTCRWLRGMASRSWNEVIIARKKGTPTRTISIPVPAVAPHHR